MHFRYSPGIMVSETAMLLVPFFCRWKCPVRMSAVLHCLRMEIRDFQDIDFFRTDLREVFGFVQRSGDPDAEKRFTFEN